LNPLVSFMRRAHATGGKIWVEYQPSPEKAKEVPHTKSRPAWYSA